ncbi:MAG: rhomboid family intramembrane serine protease [Planctomycetota bacterium]|nr:rhomboid family intramembrane serine protease [Planctomycetota bacterium]
MSRRLEWETARDADPYDAWGTITLIVVSLMLSVFEFRGSDFHMLHLDYRWLPQEPWRHLSSTALHGGWMHLAMNAMWMLQLGVVVEALLGLTGFSLLALTLAAASSMAQWTVSGPSVGLSGIVYGLFGVLWALDRWHPRCRGVMAKRTAEFFAAWFLVCLLLSWYDIMPIGNTAHGMGFLVGAGTGWALARNGNQRIVRMGLPVALCLLAYVGTLPAVRHLVNRSKAYERELFNRGVAALQGERYDEALELYEALVERTPDEPDAWHNLAFTLQRLQRYEEADEAWRKSEELGYRPDGE